MSVHTGADKLLPMARTRFIWIVGVLGWGLGTAVLFTIVVAWLRGLNGPRTLGMLLIAMVVFPLAGYVFGAWMWTALGRRARGARDTSREYDA